MSTLAEVRAVSPEKRAEIAARLAGLMAEERAGLLLAVESGSRAWGFHSPDSDYDVRFLYTRPIDWHLSVHPGRDVIERPVDAELDLSGWDLRKTLGLILGSNAVALEWLHSPIRYAEAPGFADALLGFAHRALRRRPVLWHYRRLAERQAERLRGPDGAIRFKRYFYVVRPALALRWLRLRPAAACPPMDMATLLAEADVAAADRAEIEALIAAKREVGEAASLGMSGPVDALIEAELAAARRELAEGRPEARPALRDEANRLHARWTRALDPGCAHEGRAR